MIQFANNIWVGNSADAEKAPVDAILNVAKDLKCKRGWPEVEYAQVGLVDGPGNPISTYCAAVLALNTLVLTGPLFKRVLVYCHDGKSRSVSVALMYMCVVSGNRWDDLLSIISERVGINLPQPHEAHKAAFDIIDYKALAKMIGGI